MNYSAKQIFLIDSIGALTTGLLLSQVLIRWETYFGMPSQILWTLAGIAFGFAIYSTSCHLLIKKNFAPFLKIIILANLSYCLLTSTLIIIHFQQLQWLGIAYFVGEIIVIGLLVSIEYKVLKRQEKLDR